MEVHRNSESSFQIVFNDKEVKSLEHFSSIDNKDVTGFVKWLLSAGVEIFSLTLDRKGSDNELEG